MSLLTPLRRDEDGAIALMTVILSVVIFGVAAVGIDIAMLAMERQKLHDAVDAAAHAGAFTMPASGDAAMDAAREMALTNDPDLRIDFTEQNPHIRLWCVVASTGASTSVRVDQIPSTCNPGTAPFTTSKYPDLRCNTKICKIPCAPSLTTTCNTVEVVAEKNVPFGFANVFGKSEGSTGSVASAACKGSCGQEAPNPMNVMFMADRTPSMSEPNRELMKTAINDTLETMTPSLHYVAVGALHKSKPDSTCATRSTAKSDGATGGKWAPVEFSDTYLTGGATPALNPSDALVKAVDCLPEATGGYGTNLAAALKGAGRYLLGSDPNNLKKLPARQGEPANVVIFETDGMPDETIENHTYKGIGNAADFSAGDNGYCRSGKVYGSGSNRGFCTDYVSNGNGKDGCENFARIAAELKAQDVTVITIGFGEAATAGCDVTNRNYLDADVPHRTSSTNPVRDYLAQAASPNPTTGEASVAEGCASSTQIAAENEDGDYFFCAASGGELADIFKTAVAQVSTGVRLVKLP
jgi:Putative Flp pilus-assembly TadE/G-like